VGALCLVKVLCDGCLHRSIVTRAHAPRQVDEVLKQCTTGRVELDHFYAGCSLLGQVMTSALP
jgi:hypothetical protein